MISKLIRKLLNKAGTTVVNEKRGDHVENLSRLKKVSLSPISHTQGPLELPVWFDFDATCKNPATYDGTFWEIEPSGEYVFFLAGDYKKNEKGLLRFRTAPIEVRAERCFETDVIAVAQYDGLIEQNQAIGTAADLSDLTGICVFDAVSTLLANAQDLGHERWIIPIGSKEVSLKLGISRLALGRRFISKKPYVEIVHQKFYGSNEKMPSASMFQVTTWSDDPNCLINDLAALHNSIVSKYQNMPNIPLSGATRL